MFLILNCAKIAEHLKEIRVAITLYKNCKRFADIYCENYFKMKAYKGLGTCFILNKCYNIALTYISKYL